MGFIITWGGVKKQAAANSSTENTLIQTISAMLRKLSTALRQNRDSNKVQITSIINSNLLLWTLILLLQTLSQVPWKQPTTLSVSYLSSVVLADFNVENTQTKDGIVLMWYLYWNNTLFLWVNKENVLMWYVMWYVKHVKKFSP